MPNNNDNHQNRYEEFILTNQHSQITETPPNKQAMPTNNGNNHNRYEEFILTNQHSQITKMPPNRQAMPVSWRL